MNAHWNRRRWLGAAGAAALAGAAGCLDTTTVRRRRNEWLAPGFAFAGARLIGQMDPSGNAVPQSLGAWMPLTFPVAVAPTQLDIYVADAGAGRLLRYDRALAGIAVLPGIHVLPTTRIKAGPDGSVYVLDEGVGEIRRYGRGGRQLPSLAQQRATSRYIDFDVDQLTGRAYTVDSAYSSIDEIQPLGNIAIEFLRVDEPGPIASDGRSLYVAGSRCGCVTQYTNGRASQRFGAGKLRQPRALAHAGGMLWALDAAERGVLMIHEQGVEVLAPSTLGLLEPRGIAAGQGQLWVADSGTRNVASFQISARRSAA